MRAERIEWFDKRNPFLPELVELMDLGVFLPLRIKDDQNRQIFVIRTAAHDPKQHSQNDVFKVGDVTRKNAARHSNNSFMSRYTSVLQIV